MPPRAPLPIQWDLVVESFSEASFLWARWEDAMHSPRHTLDDVVHWVEARLQGSIDGVRLGGARALETVLVPALTGPRHRPATVAAHILTSMGRLGIEYVVAAMAAAKPERVRALGLGVAYNPGAQWPSVFVEYLARLPTEAQATMIDAFAVRRWQLPPGMDAHVDRDAKPVQLATLRLAATVRDPWASAYVNWGLQRSDPRLRIEACRSALLRGHADATSRAGELIRAKMPGCEPLLPLVVLGRGERLLPMLQARLEAGDRSRALFDAIACVGTIEAADLCASLLDDPAAARLAADGLRAITGIDPTPPPGTVREPDDCPRELLLLPLPLPDALRAAWQAQRGRYGAHQRHLGGRPFAPEDLHAALVAAPMRRRHTLAAELGMRTAAAAQVTTTTWTRVQRTQLAAVGAAIDPAARVAVGAPAWPIAGAGVAAGVAAVASGSPASMRAGR